jgi:HK97 family phage major capsid protein/HK97 family phage prohead protease
MGPVRIAIKQRNSREEREKEATMPMKPRKGESQSDFMGRCVPDLKGDGKRETEQAVAACLQIWRDSGRKAPPPKKSAEKVAQIIENWKRKFGKNPSAAILRAIEDATYPEEDEDYDDFIQRCIDEVTEEGEADVSQEDAENLCEEFWSKAERRGGEDEGDEEASGARGIVHKTHATNGGGMEFILSDATPDRFGDIVQVDGWTFESFARNPVALFNHSPNFPIGTWTGIRVHDKALRGNLVLAPKGISPRIDEIRGLVEAGVLRAVSVGFKPLSSRPVDETRASRGPFDNGPSIFTKCELVECSLVSIPANPNALAVAKSLHISPEVQKLIFAEHGDKKSSRASASARNRAEHGSYRRRALTGEHAEPHRSVGGHHMLLGRRVEDAEKRVIDLQDQLQAHLDSVDDQNPDDASMTVTEELSKKVADAERFRDNLKAAEARLAKASERSAGNGDGSGNGSREIVRTVPGGGPRPFHIQPKKINPMDYVIRQGIVQAFAHTRRISVDDARRMIYGEDEATKVFIDYATKAASAPAMTTVTGWAAELVQTVYSEFMALLVPASVMPRLSAKGLALTFGRAGRIVIPTRNATPSIAGSFVGEGAAIPVRQAGFGTQSLVPKKLAVITTWTREMDEHSIPAVEGLLREAIQQDTSTAIDTVLLDANPATAIRPAGLRNGVSGLTPTAGGGFNALVGDIKALSGALLTATAGNIRNGVFLMNPQQTLSISLTQPPNAAVGLFPFADEIAAGRLRTFSVIESANVPLGMVIALDAADFVSVGSEAPRFEVSDQATLHMEDTAPTDITGGTPSPATPVKSMFQTDSMALRLIWPMNWVLRRTGMVSWLTGVTW